MSSFWAELSNDLQELFKTEIGYDVIIYAGEEQNVREFHAHSNILCVRSQYFRSAFFNEWAEKKDGKFIFRKPNIEPHLFIIILRFIYCGNIELENLQGPDVLKLLIAVDELNIQPLINYIQEFLIEHYPDFLYENSVRLLETTAFTDLWNFCLEKICEEPKAFFDSDEFINLSAPLLELLLKREDLNMNEIDIWENLLKWYLAQNDQGKNVTEFENSLQKFTSLIRFYDIGSADFFCKVYCYKDILPNNLIHDLVEFHTGSNAKPKAPSRNPFKLDSTLVKPEHISLFSSWVDVDKKNSSHNHKHGFKLLYRSSNDGFNTASFHKNCDGKGATIWVAKIQDTEQLIGGYNPLDWDGDYNWKNTSESFLFNFTDAKDITTVKLAYVNHPQHAIYCDNNKGPTMGNLYCPNSNNWSYDINGECYPKIGIPANFIVENYEVFQIIKR